MKLDFKSLAFGYSLENGGGTPAWETSLGQGAGYKLKDNSEMDKLVKGMVYKAVSPKTISFKKGKGGKVINGDADNSGLVIAAVFDKVFINEHKIENGKFILIIVKDDSPSHAGRLKLKYGVDNTYKIDGNIIKNQDFIDMVGTQLGLSQEACWFVYDISIQNQDTLRLSTVIVNKDESMVYTNSSDLHNSWEVLINETPIYNDSKDIFSHNLYGIHIKLQNDALSETNPHICIGWSGMGDLSGVTSKDDLSVKYDAAWPNEKSRKKGQDIGQIWRFVGEMKVGDYVVFSAGDICHIGKITSDYYFDNSSNPNQDADYKNNRKVVWLKKDISKSDLSQAFQNSLGAAMSVFGLNDYKSAVYDLLNDSYVKDLSYEDEIAVVAEEDDNIYSVEELAKILSKMYDLSSNKTTAIHMFGLKYAKALKLCESSVVDVVKKSSVSDSYHTEVSKGMRIYESILNNEYGIYFADMLETSQCDFEYSTTNGDSVNKIFYGVPGCGKSYHIEHNILGKDKTTKLYSGSYEKDNIIRTTFYQDYSNTDFVGQILPKIIKGENREKDTVEYIFNPGPFTLALIRAISNPTKKVALVVEEINRGNAPAIFGDIFQLLDRDDDSISEYGIVNVGMLDYLNDYEFDVDGEKKRYSFKEIKIPGNLDIFATMNTSDQNVYTLDTAFTRRWSKERIANDFNGHRIKDMIVPGMEQYTWGVFVEAINKHIQDKIEDLQVNEDKQIGAFFVKEVDLLAEDNTKAPDDKKEMAKAFAYKVLEYLWDDVSKLDHSVIFNTTYKTFEKLVEAYISKGVEIFNNEIFKDKPIRNITQTVAEETTANEEITVTSADETN